MNDKPDNNAERVAELEQIVRELRAELARVNERLAEYRMVNKLATNTIERYAARFGALS